jgi:hypothetical protein
VVRVAPAALFPGKGGLGPRWTATATLKNLFAWKPLAGIVFVPLKLQIPMGDSLMRFRRALLPVPSMKMPD